MIKICPYCGKKFETDRKIKKFCCTKCQVNYNNQIIKEKRANKKKHCRYCGKEFSQKWNEQYCSEKCRIQARREKERQSFDGSYINTSQHLNHKKFFENYCAVAETERGISLCNTFLGNEGEKTYWELRKEYVNSYDI